MGWPLTPLSLFTLSCPNDHVQYPGPLEGCALPVVGHTLPGGELVHEVALSQASVSLAIFAPPLM